MAPKDKGKPGLSTCCACGCSVFFFLLVFVVCLAGLLWFGFPLLASLRTKPSLPEKPKIAHADWKSLDTKLKATKALGSQSVELELTIGEFNALLNRFNPDPSCGLAVHQFWMVSSPGKGTFFAECSGFWLNSLIISFSVLSGEPGPDGFPTFHRPAANRLELDAWVAAQAFNRLRRSYLSRVKEQFFPHSPAIFDKIEFGSDTVILYGNFSDLLEEKGK